MIEARLEEYQEVVGRAVRGACIDRTEDGRCAPPEGRRCALELNLPGIILAVKAVKSDRLDEYADSIRDNVCAHCINQDVHGDCRFRKQLDCCLDNFLSLVVDAIEDVDRRHEAGTGTGAAEPAGHVPMDALA